MASPAIRVHLAGRVSLEVDGHRVEQQAFPGQQGRVAFAYLVCERSRPVSRAELAGVLWSAELPAAWDSALSAIISKLRSLLGKAGLDATQALTSGAGCYELRFPGNAWVDLDVAAESIHEAEVALTEGRHADAYGPSAIGHHIARRPLFAGDEGTWVEGRRDKLRSILVRALECRAQVYLWNSEFTLAVEAAKDVVALEPFRETGHQLLMRSHAAAGNTAESLLAYERCRALLAEELGVDPSRQTKQLHDEVLASL